MLVELAPGARRVLVSGFSLVELSDAHVDVLRALVADPEACRFTRIPEPPPDGFAAAWAGRYAEGRAAGTSDGFAVVDAASGAAVGVALAPRIDRVAREAELGYLLLPSARGRGAATAALRQLTAKAHDEWDVVRAYLLIDVRNTASARVAERCGYTLEGVLRSLHLKQDRRGDTQVWSHLPGEPLTPAGRAPRG